MARKRIKMSDQLRHVIETSGKSRYRIWQETGIDQSTLSKFMLSKGGLSTDALDRLADFLDLNITTGKRRRTTKGK